jgi:hypothetical protein
MGEGRESRREEGSLEWSKTQGSGYKLRGYDINS